MPEQEQHSLTIIPKKDGWITEKDLLIDASIQRRAGE
jgi:hypothetical protein